MFSLTLFCFSTYYLLNFIISFNSIWNYKLKDWKTTEGIVFRLINESKKNFEIRFVTEELEWITAVPIASSYVAGPFIGDKVTVYYNSKNPYEFAVNAKWMIQNARIIKLLIILLCLYFTIYSMYLMIDSGFAETLLRLF